MSYTVTRSRAICFRITYLHWILIANAAYKYLDSRCAEFEDNYLPCLIGVVDAETKAATSPVTASSKLQMRLMPSSFPKKKKMRMMLKAVPWVLTLLRTQTLQPRTPARQILPHAQQE